MCALRLSCIFPIALVAAARAPPAACAAVSAPAPCGAPSDGAAYCALKGCCWDATRGLNACFYPGGNAVPITAVHIFQSAHFDAGYANTTASILALWWYTHFPRAYALGLALDARGGPERLHFMTQSWLVSLFLDCPPALPGVRCPAPAEVANFTDAVRRGYIYWHAFPYNGEAELMHPVLFRAALNLTHALDDRFGVSRKATLSQRDVPGMTRAVLAPLRAAGVQAITIGVNCYSMPGAAPRAFVWEDRASGAALATMLHPYNYGMTSYNDSVVVPGLAHAATFAWRGDNAGPPDSVQEVLDDFAYIRTQFPGANVFASTLDNFTQHLVAPAVLAALPRVTAEYGDTWIHGAASDPFKTAMNNRASALLAACLDAGRCSARDPAIANFTRLLLKNAEHTWGKSHYFLNDQTTWSNVDLQAALARGAPNFLDVVASWQEQRDWGLGLPLQALERHALHAEVAAAWADLYPPAPPPAPAAGGWVPLAPGAAPETVGVWTLAFDAQSGALGLLAQAGVAPGAAWVNASADGASVFFAAEYQTYDNASIAEWLDLYNSASLPGWISTPGCGFSDWYALGFGKVNMTLAKPTPVRQSVRQSLRGLWRRAAPDGGVSFLVASAFEPSELRNLYGAPAELQTQYDFPAAAGGSRVNVSLAAYGKGATRLPEGLFLRLRPAAGAGSLSWRVGKLGQEVDVLGGGSGVLEGGNQRQHGAVGGVRVQQAAGARAALQVLSPDAPLATFGDPSIFPVPTARGAADPAFGLTLMLMNNLWSTNYPFWQPWKAGDENIRWRFSFEAA